MVVGDTGRRAGEKGTCPVAGEVISYLQMNISEDEGILRSFLTIRMQVSFSL